MRKKINVALLFAFASVLGSCKKDINTKTFEIKQFASKFISTDLASTSYTFTKVFDDTNSKRQQGLAFGAQSHFIAFDMDSGRVCLVQ